MQSETGSFPKTDWSLIDRLTGDEAIDARRLSLDDLLRRYLPPMRRFVRRRFHVDAHVADDWVQEFATTKILQSELLTRADRDRGRFRSFLSSALCDFAIDQIRSSKRDACEPIGVRDSVALVPRDDPMATLDRSWAEHAIEEALMRTKERLCSTKRAPAWAVFSRRFLETDNGPRDYRSLAAEFAFDTPSQAAMALRTAKRILRSKLSEILIEFGATKADLPAAISDLRHIFHN